MVSGPGDQVFGTPLLVSVRERNGAEGNHASPVLPRGAGAAIFGSRYVACSLRYILPGGVMAIRFLCPDSCMGFRLSCSLTCCRAWPVLLGIFWIPGLLRVSLPGHDRLGRTDLT
jgi:hypothetical protein